MTTISKFNNGNCVVELFSDGSKTRSWPDGEVPSPVHPESVDLKITDYCDAGCPYCHESSTKRGKHASVQAIMSAVDGLPAGVEIAIGGGNPLDHPNLEVILREFHRRGLVANLTVNGKHCFDSTYAELLVFLRRQKLVYGLGLSFTSEIDTHAMNPHLSVFKLDDPNIVIHFIAGVDNPGDARRLDCTNPKILVLGYKMFGRGSVFDKPTVDANLAKWRYWIGSLLSRKDMVVSFDNLALEQLRIREKVPPEVWNAHYMGDDGKFTMYVDAVKQEYAVSSTSPRTPVAGKSIREMFMDISRR